MKQLKRLKEELSGNLDENSEYDGDLDNHIKNGDLNMYASKMENNMKKLQNIMSQFNGHLISVQNGTRSFEDIKSNVQGIKNELSSMYNDINSLTPPNNLITLHNTVKEGCYTYLEGVNEFMKFYSDGNDEHFVTGGLQIQKGTELMYKAAEMF